MRKMSISKKVKANNNSNQQNKAQYKLDRKTATISALEPRRCKKIQTGKDVLLKKGLARKSYSNQNI